MEKTIAKAKHTRENLEDWQGYNPSVKQQEIADKNYKRNLEQALRNLPLEREP